MTLNEVHVVVAKDAKGVLKVIYVGEDAGAAEAKYESAKDDLDVVGILNFPQFSRLRFPLADVERQKEREHAALSATESEQKGREIKAAKLRDDAEKLLADAEKLHPAEKPVEPEAVGDEAAAPKKKSKSEKPVEPEAVATE